MKPPNQAGGCLWENIFHAFDIVIVYLDID